VVLITLLPALSWFFLWRWQDQEKEPFRAMLLCFLFGMLATVPFFLLGDYASLFEDAWNTVFWAVMEEVVKALLLIGAIELTRHWFTQIVDGMIYGAALALGFAFAENLFYLWPLFESLSFGPDFWVVYLVRSLNTMVAHSLFTALFGFFYASAYLRKEVFPEKKKEKPWAHFWKNLWESLPLHVTLVHLLPNRPSKHGHYPGSLIFEGILVASLLHALFNALLQWEWQGTNLTFLTFPLVFLMAWVLWRVFLGDVYVKIVKKVKA